MTERDEQAQERESAPAPNGTPEAAAASEAPDQGVQDVAGQPVEHDLEELLAKARERDEFLSLAQRTQADFENYRKRVARDSALAEDRGLSRLARELLPALDNLERALASAEQSEHHLAEGIRLVQTELAGALARVGIEAYSPAGERFDPEQHEAMAQQPVEGAEPGTVVEVYQQGYRLNGAILRPARVVVAG
jgi:molecular chaperone GrpE